MKSPAGKRRIVLVDDHPVVLNGWQLMLNAHAEYVVSSTATTETEALAVIERDKPDLVITDLNMPGRGGIELIKDLVTLHPGIRILVSSMHDEMLYANRALHAGAKGYVNKNSTGATMLEAIQRVLDGGVYISPQLAAHLAEAFATKSPRGSNSPMEKLSDREFQVFTLFGEGKTAKEIGSQLNLSPKTISVHRDHIKEKMGFATSAEMIRQAVRWVESQGGK